KELFFNGVELPVDLGIEPDLKGNGADKHNVLWAGGVSLILPDKTYYDQDNPSGPQLMQVFTQMMMQLLTKLGKSEDEAQAIIDGAKRFDASIAPFRKNSEELSDVAKLYNPWEFDHFADMVQEIDVKKLVQALIGTVPEKLIITEPKFYENLHQIVNADTFEDYKKWAYVNMVRSLSGYLSEEFRQ
ncbi:M13 family metallopeptidase, partial [Enterococcus faecium]|nr:M13 family metallopeptidase [Enterococcus faecium]